MLLADKNLPCHTTLPSFSLATIKTTLSKIFAETQPYTPDLVVLIKKGRLNLTRQARVVFEFQNIDATIRYQTDAVKIVLKCKSNLWEHINFNGRITSAGHITDGNIDLTHFRPHMLMANLLSAAPWQVTKSRLDLKLSFETAQQHEIFAELQGSLPYLELKNNAETLVCKGKAFKAFLTVGLNETLISLSELILDSPQLRMMGELRIDQKTPQIKIDLRAREVNVESARKASLFLAGSSHTIQTICRILKGGTIPLITVNAQGNSLNELGKIENIRIGGQIDNGKIFIPGAHLNLVDVQGNVLISQGILEGKDLQARTGNSYGRDGILKLGLKGKAPPIRLEIMTHTDIAQLSPVFKRLIKNEGFRKEINRFSIFKGSAEAKLILYDNLRSISLKALVTEADLYTDHDGIPYPLKIQGGQISLRNTSLLFRLLRLQWGNPIFRGLGPRLTGKRSPA